MNASAPEVPAIDAVLARIEADRRAGRFDAWARSTVVDENIGEAVIDRELFDALHAAAGVDAAFPVGNAGVIHVYGYLFSTVRTPFGLKSDRWNDGALARTLGLPADRFRLGASADETPLERVLAAAAPLLETTTPDAEWRVGETTQRAVVARAADGTGALVSGVDAGDGMRLLTVFPVADAAAFAAAIGTPDRLRWNAAA
ncbi:amino acid deaminase [Microbacterium halophytorum]|uniref:amino acid deaminase n=1 Tax=Microbacterium halophytorum TaxID=2067568 RepID=UPI00131A10F3|nr:amino acid deaminase [Microbacterium halophytorum]